MVEQWRIRLLMQETQKPQAPSLGHKIPVRRKWQLTPVFFSRESWTEELTAYGVTKELDGWAYLSKRAEAQSKDRSSNESEQERDSLLVNSDQPGFSVRVFLSVFPSSSFYLSKEEKKKKQTTKINMIDPRKTGERNLTSLVLLFCKSSSWTLGVYPLLLSGDENFQPLSPSQLQSHSCFPTKADK